MSEGTIEIPLEKTVFHGGRFVRKLQMRAPTQLDVDETCAAVDDAGERGLHIIAKLCGVRPGVLTKLSEADYTRLEAAYCRLADG